MVLSHSSLPFDQRSLTVRLHFESWVLKNTRQHLFNSSKGWPLNIPFDPSPSGQGAHLFRYAIFGSWRLGALGVGWGSGPLGAATRSPRRRRPFHFFRDSAWFLTQTRVLPDTTTDDDGRRNRAHPRPHSKNRKSPKFIAKFFWAILKNRRQGPCTLAHLNLPR